MNNNDYRRKQFEKRRSYKGTISMCEGYDCPIFLNCLVEIKQLKIQISAREEVCNRLESNWNKLKQKMIDSFNKTQDVQFLDVLQDIEKLEQGSDSNE